MTATTTVSASSDQYGFNQLIADYWNQCLRDSAYEERLAIARHPLQVTQDTVTDLHHLIMEIQQRPQLRGY